MGHSIIKNLLLNARGLAVPTGEGDDAVYTCPLCALEFRTAEDLQVHNSSYCQGSSSSAPISPVSSPSCKYLRSNSINVSLPELNNPNSLVKLDKTSIFYSKNPLSLVKLAWSQLKTKPSTLVLNQLNGITASKASASAEATSVSSSTPSTSAAASAPSLSLHDIAANNRFIDAPLPSPGPLLGKTPLVEAYNHGDRKSGEIVIRKVHEDQQSAFLLSNKRVKYEKGYPQESMEPSISLRPLSPPTHSKNTYSLSNYSNMESSDKNNERSKRYSSSGGCMIPISECPDVEMSPKMIRTPLLSGGSFQEVSPKPKDLQQSANKQSATPKMMIPITPLTPSLPPSLQMSGPTHFQFPPINSITAFNPLTLPFVQHNGGEKVIPYVPGIPGPNCLTPQLPPPPQQLQVPSQSRNSSPNRQKMTEPSAFSPKPKSMLMETDVRSLATFGGSSHLKSEFHRMPPSPAMRAARWVASVGAEISKKSSSFNFSRMADNVSPRKVSKAPENEKEVRHFNFDYLAKEPESIATTKTDTMTPLHVEVTNSYRRSVDSNCDPSAESFEEKSSPSKRSKFLRPTSLPLKPGTFTPKRHHGITPTANTLPLISPETPRPSKATVQLYLNGHAYTYLGLKCSTKMFYCTVNCPQPSYVANMHKLSMYSVWQVCAENNPHPLGFKPKTVLSLYDARQKSCAFTMAGRPSICTTVHSQNAVMTPFENNSGQFYHHQLKAIPALAEETSKTSDSTGDKDSGNSQQPPLIGGYESYEDYTYIRGRGRGRFVCMECGIRCKKPSMLKKHIRTHTDVRPYTCIDCNFSFKTKGNLTKHMQSKTHFKKCFELGINPGPMPADGKFMEPDFEYDQQSITSGGGRTSSFPGESESDDYSDNETESSDTDESKSRLQEHEAARCLLSLSMTPPIASSVSPKDSYTYQQTESHAPQQQVLRRVVSFTSPKPPFDYQKQEQYYSNPRESQPLLPSTQDESTMLPIDLTKPRPQESVKPISTSTQFAAHMRDIIGVVNNESMFMKSLINVTDRVRNKIESSAARLDTSAFHNAYLTEQALHYSKIKQSQMNRNSNEVTSSSNGTTSTNVSHLSMCTTTTVSSSAVVSSGAVMTTTSKQIEPITPTSSDESKPEKVAATEQAKPESESAVNVPVTATAIATPTSAEPSATLSAAPVKAKVQGNAKSVASEYLKMASLKSKSSTRPEESGDESVSDHEALTADSAVPSVPSTTQASASSAPTTGQEYSSVIARTVIVGEDGFRSSSNEVQPVYPRVPISSDGRPVCTICSKAFQKQHQLVLHMNIHYMERKFKCEPCAVSFRTQGHLQKHERSEGHKTKIMMTSTFGVPTTKNPRPFECTDCKIAFRIHGHLAKHLRSKTHVQKLECLQKLPFGTYAEIERAGISLTEIDTSDCDNSLISLKVLAQKLIDLDPTKMGTYTTPSGMQDGPNQSQNADSGSEDGYDAQNPNDDAGKGDENSSSAQNSGGHGLKRRMQPFSSSDEEQQQQQQQHQLDSLLPEKRPRTHSDVSSN